MTGDDNQPLPWSAGTVSFDDGATWYAFIRLANLPALYSPAHRTETAAVADLDQNLAGLRDVCADLGHPIRLIPAPPEEGA